jgi:chromobox protein 1
MLRPCRDARDALAAYHKRIKYNPAIESGPDSKGIKRQKSKSNLKTDSSPPVSKRSKVSHDDEEDDGGESGWFPKTQSWESQIKKIEHIDRDSTTGQLTAYIRWKDSSKANTKVSMNQIYEHCPIAMLKFYEKHLKFTAEP